MYKLLVFSNFILIPLYRILLSLLCSNKMKMKDDGNEMKKYYFIPTSGVWFSRKRVLFIKKPFYLYNSEHNISFSLMHSVREELLRYVFSLSNQYTIVGCTCIISFSAFLCLKLLKDLVRFGITTFII